MILSFLGTAGSGKTTLTKAFGKYLEGEGYRVAYVNLDTGVKKLPYTANVNVREIVTVEEIMEEGYGPNGAIVESYDRLLPHVGKIVEEVLALDENVDYTLVDTPGQMESFLFHEFGVRFMENLPSPLVAYLFDPGILKAVHDYCFVRFFTVMIDLRLGATTIPVMNKVDILSEEEFNRHRKFLEDLEYLSSRLKLDPSTQGLLAYKMCSFLPEVSPPVRIVYASALDGSGFEDLATLSYEHYCTCGDLT